MKVIAIILPKVIVTFVLFLSFLTNQKQESGFQKVSDLVIKKMYVFCL